MLSLFPTIHGQFLQVVQQKDSNFLPGSSIATSPQRLQCLAPLVDPFMLKQLALLSIESKDSTHALNDDTWLGRFR